MSETEAQGTSGRCSMSKDIKKRRPSEMKLSELKEELKKRNLKTSGSTSELILRLEDVWEWKEEDAERGSDIEEDTDESGSSCNEDDESEREEARHEQETRKRTSYRGPKTTLSFRDVEESMSTYSGTDGVSIHSWLEEFEEMASLCCWEDVRKIVYAKRLLRGSAINYSLNLKIAREAGLS